MEGLKETPSIDVLFKRLAEARSIKRLAPKQEGDKIETEVEFPAWFKRTGIRSFEIDTGLGVVKCITSRDSLDKDERGEDGEVPETFMVPLVVHALRSIPSWPAEEDLSFPMGGDKPALTVPEGQPLPQPKVIKDAPFEAQKEYLHNLGHSLVTQVFLGLGYMTFPALPSDPTPSA